MFLEIVHINGLYDPAVRQHDTPQAMYRVIPQLGNVVFQAVNQGWDVLYRQNWGRSSVTATKGTMAVAAFSDPLLRSVSKNVAHNMHVVADGSDLPLSASRQLTTLENQLVQKHCEVFVVGAFLNECVLTVARDIVARNPDGHAMIDASLSVVSPARPGNSVARYDIRMGSIMPRLFEGMHPNNMSY